MKNLIDVSTNNVSYDDLDNLLHDVIIIDFFDNHNDALIDELQLQNHDLYNHFKYYFVTNDELYCVSTNIRYYDYTKNNDNDFYDYKIDSLSTKITKINNDDDIDNILSHEFIIFVNDDILNDIFILLNENKIYDNYINDINDIHHFASIVK